MIEVRAGENKFFACVVCLAGVLCGGVPCSNGY